MALVNSRRTISVDVALGSAAFAGGELEQIQFLLGTFPCRPPSVTSVAPSGFHRR
jgi:hypothetical protein